MWACMCGCVGVDVCGCGCVWVSMCRCGCELKFLIFFYFRLYSDPKHRPKYPSILSAFHGRPHSATMCDSVDEQHSRQPSCCICQLGQCHVLKQYAYATGCRRACRTMLKHLFKHPFDLINITASWNYSTCMYCLLEHANLRTVPMYLQLIETVFKMVV